MAALALQHGYGMAAVDKDVSIALYSKTLTNFGAAYAATHEPIKNQASSLATMQGQLANIQQFCMAIGQRPPSAPVQHQHMSYNRRGRGGDQDGSRYGGGNQQPTWYGFGGAGAPQSPRAPTAFKCITKLELLFYPWG